MEWGEVTIAYEDGRGVVRHETIPAQIYGAFAAHPAPVFAEDGTATAPPGDVWQVSHVATGRAFGFACAPEVARELARKASAAIEGRDLATPEEWMALPADDPRFAALRAVLNREEVAAHAAAGAAYLETNMQRAHRAYRERLSTAFHTAAEQSVTMIANALAWHVRCSPACQGGRHVEYLELEPATAHTEEEIGAAIGAFLEEFLGARRVWHRETPLREGSKDKPHSVGFLARASGPAQGEILESIDGYERTPGMRGYLVAFALPFPLERHREALNAEATRQGGMGLN